MINSERGTKLIEEYGNDIIKCKVDINNITIINKQLREPSKHSDVRKQIVAKYEKNGYIAIEKSFQKYLRKQKLKQTIKKIVPNVIIKMSKR